MLTRPRYVLPILVLAALTTSAGAVELPRGYVGATIYAQRPGARHGLEAYIPRKFCGLKVPALVRDESGELQPASAGAICR